MAEEQEQNEHPVTYHAGSALNMMKSTVNVLSGNGRDIPLSTGDILNTPPSIGSDRFIGDKGIPDSGAGTKIVYDVAIDPNVKSKPSLGASVIAHTKATK